MGPKQNQAQSNRNVPASAPQPAQSTSVEQTPKQLLVDRVKSLNNILITVGRNPSIDQLAGAIGLSLILTKMDKHSTAVASGNIPSVIQFLEPEKVLRPNVDNLRDFIISLDKERADKLRYKVEDNVVKIYITPYRDALSQADLTFEQGEINVELIIALGVKNKDDLDEAIASHGKILHDATIATINAGEKPGTLGSVNWNEPTASSVCEMLVSVSEAFQGGLLDQQISNALLTGIVAATDKFSGNNTTPKVMTMSAQLMAAGADQHLIIDNIDKVGQDNLRQKFAEDKAANKQGGAKSKKRKSKKGKPQQSQTNQVPQKQNQAPQVPQQQSQPAVDQQQPVQPTAPTTAPPAPKMPKIVPEVSPGLPKQQGSDVSFSDSIRPEPNLPKPAQKNLVIDPVTGKPKPPADFVPPGSIDVPEVNNEQKNAPIFNGTATAAANKLNVGNDGQNHIASTVSPSGDNSAVDFARSSIEEALQAAQNTAPSAPPSPQI